MINNTSYIPQNNFTVSKFAIRGTSQYVLASSGIVKLYIYESLDQLVHGSATILDQSGLVDRLKMTGNELLELEFNSRSGNSSDPVYKKTFRITSFSRASDDAGVNELIEIKFCNQADVDNRLIKKSKAFINKTVSECVTELLSEFKAFTDAKTNIEVEETLYTRDYRAPLLHPFDIIKELAKNCSSKPTRSCTFFFYEDRDGVKFKSLGALKEQAANYTIRNQAKDEGHYNAGDGDVIYAQALSTQAGADVLETTYGNQTIEHSLVNKSIVYHNLDNEQFKINNPLMNDNYPLQQDTIRDSDKPYQTVNLVSGDNFYQSSGKLVQGHINGVQVMELQSLIQKDVICVIPGDTDIKVGDTINLDQLTLSGEVKSEVLAGKWLITKLKHEITPTEFYTHLELMSDSNVKGIA